MAVQTSSGYLVADGSFECIFSPQLMTKRGIAASESLLVSKVNSQCIMISASD